MRLELAPTVLNQLRAVVATIIHFKEVDALSFERSRNVCKDDFFERNIYMKTRRSGNGNMSRYVFSIFLCWKSIQYADYVPKVHIFRFDKYIPESFLYSCSFRLLITSVGSLIVHNYVEKVFVERNIIIVRSQLCAKFQAD